MKKLHFTIGPVQGFVARSRRTRDLWAGSFLLSYLIGEAMIPVLDADGSILFPYVHKPRNASGKHPEIVDQLLKAIVQVDCGKKVEDDPKIGTLPNRFLAEVPDDFDPDECVKKLNDSWYRLARVVWDRFLDGNEELGNGTVEIWKRQVRGFWEIYWAVGEEANLLDLRKNWRTHVPPVEEGDKCTLMGNLQELSGYVRAHSAGERERQDLFWNDIRSRCSDLNLRQDERLSAIGMIKRFFPLVAMEVIGWPLPENYPSTPYMAALDWIALVLNKNPAEGGEFASAAEDLLGQRAFESHRLYAFPKIKNTGTVQEDRKLAMLNGDCFFDACLANQKAWPGVKKENLELMRKKLGELQKSVGVDAQPHYAMVLLDGDNMGKLISRFEGSVVSNALQSFTEKVKSLVQDHNGVTVYAGGDDVLALFPVSSALRATDALDKAYRKAFSETGFCELATASAAIIYAHYKVPLMSVYMEAHRALDEVAKDGTGRHSLAITIWKGSGPVATWSVPWRVLDENGVNGNNLLERLVLLFNKGDREERRFTSSFLYELEDYFLIFGLEDMKGKVDEETMICLLVAEYMKFKENRVSRQETEENIRLLLKACRQYYREDDGTVTPLNRFSTAGARVLMFLHQNGGDPN